MKNATPSDKRKHLALTKINSKETVEIAQKYRKAGGIHNQDFEYLVEELGLPYRNEAIQNLISGDNNLLRAFLSFRKALTKKYPEYKYLIMRDDWEPVIAELFIFGDIQDDTYKVIPFGNISWTQDITAEKALYIKIIPGADNKQVIDFLNAPENSVSKKFKQIDVVIPKVTARTGKKETSDLDLWVRVLDTFTSDEIRQAFALRFPSEYKERFTIDGKRKSLALAKYELIAHYVFHRFNLFAHNGHPYSDNTIKSIAQKANKDKTKIKSGLFKKIP